MNNYRKKKLLIVCNSKFAYEKFIKESIKNYKKNFSSIYLITGENLKKKNKFFSYVQMPANKISSYIYFVTAAYKIYKIIKFNSIDIVVHNNRNASICSRLAMFFLSKKIKSIYFSRGMYFHDNQNILTYLASFLLEIFFLLRTDLIMSQNHEDLKKINFFIKFFNVKKNYIGNGVDIHKFSYQKRKFNFSKKINVCTTCRISKGKGLEILFKNFKKILRFYPNCYLTIIGGPRNEEDKQYFESLKKKFDLDKNMKNILITGIVSNIQNILKKNDIYVHPSLREGMPRSLIEAMCNGLICISSNVRGSRELIKNGINAYIYKNPKDIFIYFQRIVSLKKEKLNQLSKNSHKFIKKKFNLKTYLNLQYKNIANTI
jgi:glycosyltransferase involved in cell wall biosynthesis